MRPWTASWSTASPRSEVGTDELRGTWPTLGPYTTHGIIQAGRGHPLDLGGSRQIEGRGEIFYPDGLESQEG
jgi:hypothetical protein